MSTMREIGRDASERAKAILQSIQESSRPSIGYDKGLVNKGDFLDRSIDYLKDIYGTMFGIPQYKGVVIGERAILAAVPTVNPSYIQERSYSHRP
jgi:hypothetical protein